MLSYSLLPRAAAVPSRFLRLSPLCRRITTETAPSSASASIPSETSTTSPSDSVPSRPAFLVSRTPSQQLPVYQRAKRGGNMKFTILKKVEGDVRALKSELKSELGLEDKQIKINHITGHIEISGYRKDDITRCLLKHGF